MNLTNWSLQLLADLCLEYGVQAFVLSTSLHGGDEAGGHDASHIAKMKLEKYCRELEGLNWM